MEIGRPLISASLTILEGLKPTHADYDAARTALSAKLRRFPYWRAGHQKLAAAALTHSDIALAYSSARAADILARTEPEKREALTILAKCYIATGDGAAALKVLRSIRETGELLEDFASAEMLEQEYKLALTHLERIPSSKRSAEAQVALEYCKSKVARG